MNVTIHYFAGIAAACAALAGIALFFSRQFSRPPEEGLAIAIPAIMGTVFLGACFGAARIAVYLLCALALLGFCLRVTGSRIGRARTAPDRAQGTVPFLTPPLQIFFGMVLLSALLFYGTCLQNWDEFVQWGKAVRYMGSTGSLPVGASYDGMEYMHSASTFFHCFIGTFTGFDEASLYVSNAMLCLGCVSLAMRGQTRRRCLLFSLFLLLALYALYELPFYNLYVDVALSLWTGALLLYAADAPGPEKGARKWVLPAAMFIAVSAMKPTAGILFAAIALVVLAGTLLPEAVSRRGLPRGRRWPLLLLIPAAAAVPFLIRALWSAFVSEGGIYVDWSLLKSRRSLLRPLFYTMYRGMFTGLGHADRASYAACFTGSALLLAAGRRAFPEGAFRKRWMRAAALYLIGFIGYAAVLYATYLLILPESDGLNGTSLARYFSLYAMAGILPVCAPLFREEKAPGRPEGASPRRVPDGAVRIRPAVCLLLTAALALTLKSDSLYCATPALRWDDPYYTMYMDVRACVEEVLRAADSGTVYYVNQTSDSAAAAAEYAFAGRWDRSVGAYRFTEKADTVVTGLRGSTAEELPALLLSSGSAYLYVDRSDAYLDGAFERIFSIPSPRDGDLYRVEPGSDPGTVRLVPVENARDLAHPAAELEREH